MHQREPRTISTRQYDNVARPIRDQPLQRVVADVAIELPGRGHVLSRIETLDESDKTFHVRARRRVDMKDWVNPEIGVMEQQRRMKVAGVIYRDYVRHGLEIGWRWLSPQRAPTFVRAGAGATELFGCMVRVSHYSGETEFQ